MVSQLIRELLPKYGPFPLPETLARRRQLSLRFKRSRLNTKTEEKHGHETR